MYKSLDIEQLEIKQHTSKLYTESVRMFNPVCFIS